MFFIVIYFRLDDVLKMTREAFTAIGPDRWRQACEHVDRLIQESKKKDHVIDDVVEDFIINLVDSTSDDDSSATDTASEIEWIVVTICTFVFIWISHWYWIKERKNKEKNSMQKRKRKEEQKIDKIKITKHTPKTLVCMRLALTPPSKI